MVRYAIINPANSAAQRAQDRICSLYMNAVPVGESQVALANPLVLCSTKDGEPYAKPYVAQVG